MISGAFKSAIASKTSAYALQPAMFSLVVLLRLFRDWFTGHAEDLADNGRRSVRIFNLAMPAHTSQDYWLKYAALAEARFDLVIVYDGLDEDLANNVPPELFREDYAHYSWYEIVNTLAAYHGTASFALPYTLRYLVIHIRQTMMSALHSHR